MKFKKSRGNISFLDSDDYFKNDKIKIVKKFFDTQPEKKFFDLPFVDYKGQIKKYKFVQKIYFK